VKGELEGEIEVLGENLPHYHLLPVEWPARSPDLTPINFFLWGYKKDQVYGRGVTRLQDLEKKKNASYILWKESRLKFVATLSGHLTIGQTYKHQRELRSKCSEIENAGRGGGTF
jgi:hypothetical protein